MACIDRQTEIDKEKRELAAEEARKQELKDKKKQILEMHKSGELAQFLADIEGKVDPDEMPNMSKIKLE